jgi:hypothetical protein
MSERANSESEEPFEKFEHDEALTSGGKGMVPVPSYAMINFLRWLRAYYPGITSLQHLSERQLLQLVSEFEGGNIARDEWRAGFRLLLDGHSNKEGYGTARTVLRQLGL